jgi:5-methylcytosine-specific restriction endonuclease McrA
MRHSTRCADCGVIQRNGTRCESCTHQRRTDRYGNGWAALSKAIIARDPECQLKLPGCTEISTTADHIVSVSRGGPTHDPENLQGACGHCNSSKGDRW